MRKILYLSICVGLCFLAGCSFFTKDDTVDYSADITEKINICLNDPTNSGDKFKSNLLSTKFAVEKGDVLAAALTYLKKCTVNTVSGENYDYNVIMNIPDLESIDKVISEDSGFKADYDKLCLQGADAAALREYSFAFVNSVLQGNSYSFKEVEFTVKFDGSVFEDDTFLCITLTQFLEHNFLTPLSATAESSQPATIENSVLPTEIQQLNIEQDIIDCKGTAKFRISNVELLQGKDVLTKLNDLSSANSSIVLGPDTVAYYIEYDVQNLSGEELSVENGFCFVDENYNVLQNTGNAVIGLSDAVVIPAYEKKRMSCCIFGKPGTSLFWWHDGYTVTAQINL